MKKNLSISCILLAVVTMFGLYCYRERENKNLVASIEPYTETAVILSDYIDFEKSYFKGVPPSLPPKGSRCDGCPYWRGIGCAAPGQGA